MVSASPADHAQGSRRRCLQVVRLRKVRACFKCLQKIVGSFIIFIIFPHLAPASSQRCAGPVPARAFGQEILGACFAASFNLFPPGGEHPAQKQIDFMVDGGRRSVAGMRPESTFSFLHVDFPFVDVFSQCMLLWPNYNQFCHRIQRFASACSLKRHKNPPADIFV